MDTMMNIMVRVATAAAQREVKTLRAEMARLDAQLESTNRQGSSLGSGGMPGITKWGSQVQWAGRQLEHNFTLPLVVAGAAGVKFALDNEKAMVRVQKVYGDTSMDASQVASETTALGKAFRVLSDEFGVNQAQTINIAADWAAAGASGLALAKSTKLTMETMILGELDATKATESLIAIQAQYGQTVEELSGTIDILNMVENQTGVSLGGLIDGFARAAGVARSAGVDVRHLAAMIAAMSPAAGTAAQAGNAIKTVISRLLSPTKEAAEVMGKMHINVKEVGWQSLNASQRLETMAKSFNNLDDSQKAVVSSTIASRWQINKFDVLMRDMVNTNGYYQKSLNSTANAQDNFNQRVRELNAVLNSNPQRLKQIWTILQNAAADVVQPLIPMIVSLASGVAELFRKFSELNPSIQKLALGALVVLAALGPLAMYVGSVATLIGTLGSAAVWSGAKFLGFGKLILGVATAPFQLLYAAVGSVLGLLSGLGASVVAAGSGLLSGFTGLFAGLGSVMTGVLAPLSAIWEAFLVGLGVIMAATRVQLNVIWATTLAALQSTMATFGVALRAVWAGIMSAGGTIIAAGGAGLTAAWRFVTDSMYRAFGYFSAAMSMVWDLMLVGMQAAVGAVRGGLTAAWSAMHVALVGITSAMATALSVVWSGILSTGRAFTLALAGIYALGGQAAALLVAAPARILLAFKSLPAAMSRIAPAIWTGLLTGGRFLVTGLTGWIGLAVAAALGVAYTFRKQIASVWQQVNDNLGTLVNGAANTFAPLVTFFQSAVTGIENAFWRLPTGVRDSFLSVVQIVKSAAMAVYSLFSYLNPWAHHSPSLVESVTTGINAVKKQYASVSNVGSVFSKAASDLAAFKTVSSGLNGGEFGDDRVNVAKGIPAQLKLFDALQADLTKVNAVLATQESAINRQQSVVDGWKSKLDAANKTLDTQTDKLTGLQKNLDTLNTAYDNHQTKLTNFASAPIKGMKAMQDQIFKNDQAQKKLRLGILNWEQANGTVDSLRDKMAKLQGSIETLSGDRSDLRMAGAGSDILGPISGQIDAMQSQYKAIEKTAKDSPVDKMQEELAKLETEGQILDLQYSIDFDPLLRQIDDLANGMKELSFKEIIDGITKEKSEMAKLTPQIDAANKAVEKQQVVVDKATDSRDKISDAYDKEIAKLNDMQSAYSKTTDAVHDLEDALRTLGQAGQTAISDKDTKARAKAAKKAKDPYESPGAVNFDNAKGGNFPDVGGQAKIGREGGPADQSALIDQWTKDEAAKLGKTFSGFDMFKPVKDMWNKAWVWIKDKTDSYVKPVLDSLKSIFSNGGGIFGGFKLPGSITRVWDGFINIAKNAFDSIKKIGDMFAPDFRKIWDAIVSSGKRIWDEIGPELSKFSELLPQIIEISGVLWKSLKIVAAVAGGILLGALKIVSSVLANTLGPALDIIIDILKFIVIAVREFIKLILALLTSDWKTAWSAVVEIVKATFWLVVDVIKDTGRLMLGSLKGFIDGIVDIFKYLYDVLVGHSIIPELMDAIVDLFKNLWSDVKGFVSDFVHGVIDFFKNLPGDVVDALRSLKDKLVNVASDAWDAFSDRQVRGWAKIIGWLKDAPSDAWNAIKGLKDKLVDVASSAWDAFYDRQVRGWTIIVGWLVGLGQKAWVALSNMGERLGNIATSAWDSFENAFSTGWTAVSGWLTGLAARAWTALSNLGERLGNAATLAWNVLEDAWGAGWTRVTTWLIGLAARAWTALSNMGERLGNSATLAWKVLEDAWGDGWVRVTTWLIGLAARAWTALSNMGERIGNIATSAWGALETAWGDGWARVSAWLIDRAQKVWDALSNLKAKISDIATLAWNELQTAWATGWASVKTWLEGRAELVKTALKDLKTTISDVASDAFNMLKSKASNIVDGKGGFMEWIRDIPGRVADAMSGIGSAVANATKGSWNGAANWINSNGIKNINRITSKIGFEMDDLPTFSKGGIVPGGLSKKDNVLAGLRSGEGVLVPEAVKAIGGKSGLEALNKEAAVGRASSGYKESVSRKGGIGDGVGDTLKGIAGGVGNLADNVTDWMRDGLGSAMSKMMTPLVSAAHNVLGDNLVGSVGSGFLQQVKDKLVDFVSAKESAAGEKVIPGGFGFQKQMAILAAQFPGISMNSGFRPGAITSSGNLSYHALGRAVDIPPRMEYFDWILSNYGKTSKELIFSPAGERQIKDGKPHVYSGQVKADHYNHVHWAYDQGGWLEPGVSQTINRTGKPEPVFNGQQWGILKSAATGAADMIKSASGVAPGVMGGAGTSATTLRVERAWIQITTAEVTTTTAQPASTEYHFHGDLSFPNIKSGQDAEEFIRNLKGLAIT